MISASLIQATCPRLKLAQLLRENREMASCRPPVCNTKQLREPTLCVKPRTKGRKLRLGGRTGAPLWVGSCMRMQHFARVSGNSWLRVPIGVLSCVY
jgi:hypothetical protein